MNLGLFVARAVVAVPYNHIICLKVINATTSCIVLKKRLIFGKNVTVSGIMSSYFLFFAEFC